ncbi:acetyl-CoA synthetase-like protein [Gonapodya prolifera JEL478]|uniref:Acetyl-CoA synthetase-like protein n=1 Tax=Gonapodya prolifera (strain JEL478) TaxID=1344416 RepID=A0A139B0N3_GONPJ|nr:acetyl-CoA synthetase-like protein [Gonapodya prolifera JEL478]|eukprot:KXS22500.1 acetyl-CoA synthetase-like protein [Gonapodya prolifera JEL478]
MAAFVINQAPAVASALANVGGLGAGIGAGLAASMYLDAKYSIENDIRLVGRMITAVRHGQKLADAGSGNMASSFLERVKIHPNKLAIRSETLKEYTYKQMKDVSVALGNFYLDYPGLKPGDTLAIMFENCPEIIFSYYSCYMTRIAIAPLNPHIRKAALLHCIKVASANAIMVEPLFLDAIKEVLPDLKREGIKVIVWDNGFASVDRQEADQVADFVIDESFLLNGTKASTSDQRIMKIVKETQATAPCTIMFTSGTTGLPKAGLTSHQRGLGSGASTGPLTFASPLEHDICIAILPLSHATAGVSMMTCFARGGSFVPIRRFSASKFWKQVTELGGTTFWYVGEIARYLLAQPPSEWDRAHKVERITGNGMRADVFKKFYDRFGIPEIVELYAASDGSSFITNHYKGGVEGIGSIGRRGPLVTRMLNGPWLIKITEQPIRDKNGLCILAKAGEPGECIGPYLEGMFEYRNNQAATQKKIIRDVFKKGDAYWRMGDLLSMDKDYWYYFVDRLGDTFRWKSENVSTFEVGNFLGEHPAVQEANVYGVEVPNHIGRAGAAVIVLKAELKNVDKSKLDEIMQDLGRHCLKKMPRFAVPVFIRVLPEMILTASMKHRKVEYQKEGYAPSDYWMPPNKDIYVPFTAADRAILDQGKARL